MRQLNKTLQKSIIGSWLLAWLLISAMPVIHANTKNSLLQANHCPVASMEMFNHSSMAHTPASETHESTSSSSAKKFYHCPLSQYVCLLFANFPALFANHHSTLSPFLSINLFFSSTRLFFKQPRSPPEFS
ncbi:DUF2946 family protein [Psychromonas sp. Urea-02u-13]